MPRLRTAMTDRRQPRGRVRLGRIAAGTQAQGRVRLGRIAAATHVREPGMAAATASFVISMYVTIVTLTPFKVYDAYAKLVEAKGDPVRQFVVLTALALGLLGVIQASGVKSLRSVPLSFWLLWGWIIISLLWAIAPDLAVRRIGLSLSLTMAIYSSALTIGYRRVFTILLFILVPTVVIDVISIKVVPTAVHLASERNLDLIGNWRGLHNHKNNAAPVMVLAAIIFQQRIRRSFYGAIFAVLMVLSLIFLWGTHSKTTGIFGLVAVLTFAVTRIGIDRGVPKAYIALAFRAIFLAIPALVVGTSGQMHRIFSDPKSFTGRVKIWGVLVAYWSKHALTGSGFASFWLLGARNPALEYDRGWIGVSAPHGHNGYLDALAAIGWPGLALVILALVVLPLLAVWRASSIPSSERAFIVAWFVYAASENLLESTWFSANSNCVWPIWVVAFALLNRTRLYEKKNLKPLWTKRYRQKLPEQEASEPIRD